MKRLVAGAIGAVLLLSGCGGSDEPPAPTPFGQSCTREIAYTINTGNPGIGIPVYHEVCVVPEPVR